MISPNRRRQTVKQAIEIMEVSERRACRVINQPRSTQRYRKLASLDEDILREKVIELASQYADMDTEG